MLVWMVTHQTTVWLFWSIPKCTQMNVFFLFLMVSLLGFWWPWQSGLTSWRLGRNPLRCREFIALKRWHHFQHHDLSTRSWPLTYRGDYPLTATWSCWSLCQSSPKVLFSTNRPGSFFQENTIKSVEHFPKSVEPCVGQTYLRFWRSLCV